MNISTGPVKRHHMDAVVSDSAYKPIFQPNKIRIIPYRTTSTPPVVNSIYIGHYSSFSLLRNLPK